MLDLASVVLVGALALQPEDDPERSVETQSVQVVELPVLGRLLGVPGDELTPQRVLTWEEDQRRIERELVDIWADPRTFGIRQPEPSLYYLGIADSEVAEVYIREGSVASVRLHFDRMTARRAAAIVHALGANRESETLVGSAEESLWEGYVVTDRIRVRYKLMREASNPGYSGGFPSEVDRVGAATLEIAIDPVEWLILRDPDAIPAEVSDAMRDGQLVVGMTEEQARAALARTHTVELGFESRELKQLVWYRPADSGRSRKLALSAYFRDDRVTEILRY